jgi:hypothetical protein
MNMPGHADGISCMVSFSINPTDPFSNKASDWAQLERDIREGLRVSGHKVKDVNVFHMHAAGVTIGKRAKALEKSRR